MSYHALARKYRPATFAEVVGQKHVTATLRAALRKGKLSHAYLFSGPRGCGKTTVARLLAKALNCAGGQADEPCGTCERCLGIAAGSDLDVLEIDAASHTGVDNIRELRDLAQYTPTQGANKVFIIDEVHMLSKGAFNALLKILEEPPARVYFFFATTEPNKVPRTILSRCQRFDFRLLGRAELSEKLAAVAAAEGAQLEPAALGLLVSLAEGSLRDALSALDQLIAGCDGAIDEQLVVDLFGLVRAEVFCELNEAIIKRDPAAALRLADRLLAEGESLDAFAQGIVANFRNLLVLRLDPGLGETLDLPPEQLERLAAQAAHFTPPDLLALLERASSHYERIHRSTQPRILLEAALAECALFESRVQLTDLLRRLDAQAGGAGGGGLGARGAGAAGASTTGAGASTRATRAPDAARGGSRAPTRAAQDESSAGPAVARGAAIEAGSAAAGFSGPAGGGSAAATLPLWTQLLNGLMDSHPRVAACLLEGLPSLDEARGRLLLAFPPEKAFQMEQLQAERVLIAERIAAVFGRPLALDLMMGESAGPREAREEVRRAVAPTAGESLAVACREDPPLAKLVDLLQGEPVPDQEREAWLRAGRSKASRAKPARDGTGSE